MLGGVNINKLVKVGMILHPELHPGEGPNIKTNSCRLVRDLKEKQLKINIVNVLLLQVEVPQKVVASQEPLPVCFLQADLES